MLMITLTGVLSEDCITRTDKNGHSYIRFQVVCDEPDFHGMPSMTIFQCYCYHMRYANMKIGDLVLIMGKFSYNIENGKIRASVLVDSIALGV